MTKNGRACNNTAILSAHNYTAILTGRMCQRSSIFEVDLTTYSRRGSQMECVIMGKKEQLKIAIIEKVISGKLKQKDAKVFLEVSERTLRRWLVSYKQKGIRSLVHGNKGRAPVNRKPLELKHKITELVKKEFYDFNLLHCLDKLQPFISEPISRETLRRWCLPRGLIKNARRRSKRVRYKRSRYSRFGFMLQLDGSYHRWFNNEESCLIAVIDDATSKVVGGLFFDLETTINTFTLLFKIFENYGLPSVLYVDRAGVYGGAKRTNFSQLVNALSGLDIEIIYANSPQGKGRVERLFRTLQDRLIPEMRIAGIKTKESANEFLNDIYLPHQHNPKYSVMPHSSEKAWRPIPNNKKLREIFMLRAYRKVAPDHIFSFKNKSYLICSELKYSINNHYVEILIDEKTLEIKTFFAGIELDTKQIDRKKY